MCLANERNLSQLGSSRQSGAGTVSCWLSGDSARLHFFFLVPPIFSDPSPFHPGFQLRVVRAFKSTLEDVEDKRSVHSVHSLHSLRSSRSHPGGTRPLSDISFIDEDGKTPSLPSDASPGTPKKPVASVAGSRQAKESLLRRSQHSGGVAPNHLPSETAPLVSDRAGAGSSSPPMTPRSVGSPSSSTSSSSGAPDNNNRASFSNPLTQGYNLLSEPPPLSKLHETSI